MHFLHDSISLQQKHEQCELLPNSPVFWGGNHQNWHTFGFFNPAKINSHRRQQSLDHLRSGGGGGGGGGGGRGSNSNSSSSSSILTSEVLHFLSTVMYILIGFVIAVCTVEKIPAHMSHDVSIQSLTNMSNSVPQNIRHVYPIIPC